jgi:hydroxypyruvate isomerase
MPIKQGVAWWPIGKLEDAGFKRVLDLGLTGIEMPPADSYQKFRDIGFTITTINGHKSLEDGLNKRENHARIADELRASLQVAKQFEIPNLICFSGNRNGLSEEEGAANTTEGLHQVAKDAEAAGVTLILELLNSKVDHPDYQCDHTRWGVEVIEAVNSPRVKLLYDIYHMQIMEGDLVRTIQANAQHFAHYHTAGNPGRHDLDKHQEIWYPPVVKAIADSGYTGWIGHEFNPKGDALTALQQAYDLCNV